MTDETHSPVDAAKRDLRLAARERRKSTSGRDERSSIICGALRDLDVIAAADRVLVYEPMGSEVDVRDFAEWCRSVGKDVQIPEDDVSADWPDVVIVPGLAFTSDGRRCGQGAGWYDRFLPGRRSDCVTIGVGFVTQLVDDLPTASHDITLDLVITD